MKVKKFKFKQIFKLHLLKSRMYEQVMKKKGSNFLAENDLVQTITHFKKALQVIFQYHSVNKRILFIGVPKKLEFRINKLTNHVAVSHVFNLQGIISNYSKNFNVEKVIQQKSKGNLLPAFVPKLAKKPDLIVLFSHNKKHTIISESYFAKIPLIVFNSDESLTNNGFSQFYEVQGNENHLMNTSNQNLFSIGLNFLFKRRKKKEISSKFQKFSQKGYNQNKFSKSEKRRRSSSI